MEEYKKRVIAEQRELCKKIVSLCAFIYSDNSQAASEDELHRMTQQLYVMMNYSEALSSRIANDFK